MSHKRHKPGAVGRSVTYSDDQLARVACVVESYGCVLRGCRAFRERKILPEGVTPWTPWADRPALARPVTASMREKLGHAVGLDYPHQVKRGVTWRNYYCASDGDADLEALVSAGLMERHAINEGRDRYYFATQAGLALVGIREVRR